MSSAAPDTLLPYAYEGTILASWRRNGFKVALRAEGRHDRKVKPVMVTALVSWKGKDGWEKSFELPYRPAVEEGKFGVWTNGIHTRRHFEYEPVPGEGTDMNDPTTEEARDILSDIMGNEAIPVIASHYVKAVLENWRRDTADKIAFEGQAEDFASAAARAEELIASIDRAVRASGRTPNHDVYPKERMVTPLGTLKMLVLVPIPKKRDSGLPNAFGVRDFKSEDIQFSLTHTGSLVKKVRAFDADEDNSCPPGIGGRLVMTTGVAVFNRDGSRSSQNPSYVEVAYEGVEKTQGQLWIASAIERHLKLRPTLIDETRAHLLKNDVDRLEEHMRGKEAEARRVTPSMTWEDCIELAETVANQFPDTDLDLPVETNATAAPRM